MYLEEFSQAQIELNIEITHHPELIRELNEIRTCSPNWDWTVMLAGVAAYCEIALDGYYTPDELDSICTICTMKLQQKRSIIALH